MPKPNLKAAERTLSACGIGGDRVLKVRVGTLRGKIVVDVRAFLDLGSVTVATKCGVWLPIAQLPLVIATLQRASAMIDTWELEDDAA